MERYFISLAAASGFLAVALGAFGAHALKARLDEYSLGVFRTAVEYHFYHSLALLAVGLLLLWHPGNGLLKFSGHGYLLGIVLFSGSLYLLAFTGIRGLGAVTPLGGLCFLAGWAALCLAGLRLSP